jgi:hypothetical protein
MFGGGGGAGAAPDAADSDASGGEEEEEEEEGPAEDVPVTDAPVATAPAAASTPSVAPSAPVVAGASDFDPHGFDSNPIFQRFLANVQTRGYFNGVEEGSEGECCS